MTREDIEKEAMRRFNIGEPTCGIDKFVEGANWRINSVWHAMNTMPNFNKLPILMKHKSGSIHFLNDRLTRQSYLKKHYICWAYVSDLIPETDKVNDEACRRIENVWHNMNIIPDYLPILIEHKSGSFEFIDETPSVWEYLKEYYVRWAYVKDLIPNAEGKQ